MHRGQLTTTHNNNNQNPPPPTEGAATPGQASTGQKNVGTLAQLFTSEATFPPPQKNLKNQEASSKNRAESWGVWEPPAGGGEGRPSQLERSWEDVF